MIISWHTLYHIGVLPAPMRINPPQKREPGHIGRLIAPPQVRRHFAMPQRMASRGFWPAWHELPPNVQPDQAPGAAALWAGGLATNSQARAPANPCACGTITDPNMQPPAAHNQSASHICIGSAGGCICVLVRTKASLLRPLLPPESGESVSNLAQCKTRHRSH